MIDEISIDGFGPYALDKPASIQDLCQTIYEVGSEEDYAIYPVGGRSKLGFGCPPLKDGIAIDMTAIDKVMDFPARDMTITVQAGMNVSKLQKILAPENLCLPIDVPQASKATVGGILAANVNGSRRFGYGTLRDYLIGFSGVNNEGREFKAGGRVVKNVAGYDLCKLFVGSLGTLGIITQATFKLRPLPEENALIVLAIDANQIEEKIQQVNATKTRPVLVDLLNPQAGQWFLNNAGLQPQNDRWILIVGYEGNQDAVLWQVETLVEEIGEGESLQARVGATTGPLWKPMLEFPAISQAYCTFKATLLPSQVPTFCQRVEVGEEIPLLRAHAGNGIVVGHYPNELTRHQATTLLAFWREAAGRTDGKVIVLKAPHEFRTSLFVWGAPTGQSALLRTIKEKFDPKGLFNPGRFVDGI